MTAVKTATQRLRRPGGCSGSAMQTTVSPGTVYRTGSYVPGCVTPQSYGDPRVLEETGSTLLSQPPVPDEVQVRAAGVGGFWIG